MTKPLLPTTRRGVLRGAAAAAGAALLPMPYVRPASAADRSLKVSAYGGFFEQSLSQHVYPAFTKATGIAVQSLPQAEGAQFLIQLAQANKGGTAPMDLCLNGQEDVLRGRAQGIWRGFSPAKLTQAAPIPDKFKFMDKDSFDGVGAMAWYLTFVVNADEMKPAPDSWKVLWERPTKKPVWGLSGGGTSSMFEITATVYFGGIGVLDTHEGVDHVAAKMAELKPATKLWWDDEGTMQTALQNDEILGGTYFHDVAGTMIKAGTPVRSIFPKEGAYQGFSSWCQPSASTKSAEAAEFIQFSSTPEAQELIARFVGSAPVLPRKMLSLTDAEFNSVSTDIPSIQGATAARVRDTAYFETAFTRMVTG